MSDESRREKDVETAAMCLADAQAALEEGRFLDVLEEIGHVAHFATAAAQRDGPVATVRVERAGDHDDSWTCIFPGQTKELEVHGRATVRIQTETLTDGGDRK